MTPAVTTGLLATVRVVLDTPTLVTEPPDTVVEIVTLPLAPLTAIPDPALMRVTPVLVTVIDPLVVIGLLVTLIPVPGVMPTEVTVPAAAALDIEVIRPYVSTVTDG